MKASDLFVQCLEAEGVQTIFGVPGEENLDLLDSLRSSSIRFIVTRHEQAAVFMAATYGRLTGRAGVALSTLGPGATNMVTGIAFAQLGGMPLVVITGQKPIKRSKQGQFQIIDICTMMRPLTKMTERVSSGARIPSLIREAFRRAEEERPGAVHVELPEDIASEDVDRKPLARIPHRRPGPDPKAIDHAREMIQKARHPLIFAGNGANRKRITKRLASFMAKTGIPCVTTQMGKGVIDERSELSIGTAALSDTDYIHCAMDVADLVIFIGHDVMEKPPAFLDHDRHELLHINFTSASIDDVYAPTYEVVGDVAHSLWALEQSIIPSSAWDFSYYKTVRDVLREKYRERTHDAFPLSPQRIVSDLRKALPETGILSLDNGMYKLWVARQFPAYSNNTVLLDNALATMGAGLPSAISAKLLHGERHVIALCGDGGFMMNSQELETAVRLGIDLVIVILRDDEYGMIRWKQEGMGFSSYGLNFSNPDFVKYAESYGAQGFRVASCEDFSAHLSLALASKGVSVIDCPIDYSENWRVFTDELSNKKCPSPLEPIN